MATKKLKWLLQKLAGGHSAAQPPAAAYDKLSDTYDARPGNLMIALDEVIFPALLKQVSVQDKAVVDVGCGTGRHWPLLLGLRPAKLCGYDASAGMLRQLKGKHPGAEVYLTRDHQLPGEANASADLVVSTLTLAYLGSLEETFREWNRVLKPGGSIVYTTYHPETLQHGGTITFEHGSGTIAVQHHIHTLEEVRRLAGSFGWTTAAFLERRIDEAVRHYYEQQGALAVYEKFAGKALIYGIHFRKSA